MGEISTYYCDICNKKIEPPFKIITMTQIDKYGNPHKYNLAYCGETISMQKLFLCQEHSEMIRLMMREELKKYYIKKK